ncbi:MAG: hypothetical protein AAGL66_17540, partial [Pseudomonadota bacterium]
LTDQTAGDEVQFSVASDITAPNAASADTPQIQSAFLQVALETSAPGGVLPQVSADVTATWSPTQSATPQVQFDDVAMDAGSLLELLEPVLDPIRTVLFEGPIGDVVNAVTAPIPVLDDGIGAIGLRDAFDLIPEGGGDGRINFLDILGYYFRGSGNDDAFDALSLSAETLAILRALTDLAEREGQIALGAFGFDPTGAYLGFTAAPDPLQALSNLINQGGDFFDQTVGSVPGLYPGGAGTFSDPNLTDNVGLAFPLFQNPERIAEALLPGVVPSTSNDPAAFIEYDLPAQGGAVQLGPYRIPIFGAVGVSLGGGIGFSLDFRIGYDARPLELLANGATEVSFSDGLFMGVDPLEPDQRLRNQNPDKSYEHEPVITSFAEVFVGVGVNVGIASVDVEGGVAGFSGAFIDGTIDNSSTYDSSLGSTGRLEDIGDPCFFEVEGAVNAVVRARFTINFFFFSFSWEATFAEVTIVDLEFGCDPVVDPLNGIASVTPDGDLRINAGIFADNFNRIVSGQIWPDAADHYQIVNATDENGTPIPGQLLVSWRGIED